MTDLAFELVAVAGTDVTFELVDEAGADLTFDIGAATGGVTVHNELTGRSAADAHPMSAVTGLVAALAAAGEQIIEPDFFFADCAVDGTATTFDFLVYETRGANPDDGDGGWKVGTAGVSAAAFAAYLSGGFPDGATILIPEGANFGAYFVTAATLDEAWTAVDGRLAYSPDIATFTPDPAWLGVRTAAGWITLSPVGAQDVRYGGNGMLGSPDGGVTPGAVTVHQALHTIEGWTDRFRAVSMWKITGNLDVSALLAGTAMSAPVGDYGCVAQLNTDFWLFDQTDPAENGCYHMFSDDPDEGLPWRATKYSDPEVFDPPGNWYTVVLNCVDVPTYRGSYRVWLDDDRTIPHRAGSLSFPTDPGTTGVWTSFLTVGGGGGAVDSVNGETGTVVLTAADVGAATSGHDHSGVYDPAGSGATAQAAAIAASQPLDADLTAIAALSTTAYGRALLALADAAAGRTAFGLGTASTSASGDFAAAGHNHTGVYDPAGTAAGMGTWRIELAPWAGWSTSLNATRSVDASSLTSMVTLANAAGNYVTWNVHLTAGTWALDIIYRKVASNGSGPVTLDGTSLLTLDCYAASTVRNNVSTTTGISVATSGLKVLKVATLTQGAGSGYVMELNWITLRRTA